MEKIALPNKVEFEELGDHKYKLVMEPLYPGYGMTLGNTLRRVLLSSLPGAAVVAVKIKGVDHEFSTIPNVKEDVIEIILNLKHLRLRAHGSEPVTLELKVKGEKEVKASDFKKHAGIEIINPNLHLATLDSKQADFELEAVIGTGRGYVPVEQREHEKLAIGMIAIDAIYTPVRSVNFEVRHVRVGQITNYDELVMTIETDGTISGKDAFDAASRILLDHFALLAGDNLASPDRVELEVSQNEGIKTPEADELKSLGLSNRSYNALVKNNITTLSALQQLSHDELVDLGGLGAKSIEEIEKFISGKPVEHEAS